MDSRRELLQFQPTNLGRGGIFSPDRNGLQQVVFQIPKLPRVMMGRTLRINGNFDVFKADDSRPSNATNWNADAPNDNAIFIDGRIGVSSCIDTLSIQNLKGATYSNVKNYNRLMSCIVPMNQSFNNYINGCDDEYGNGKQITQAKRCDKTQSFSIPILDGFFQAENIDMDLVEGLVITLTLSPSNFVLANNYWYNQNATTPNGAYYQWSDLVLSVETEVPDARGMEAMMANRTGEMVYKTYSSFYNVIVSNQHNLSFLFNTRKTSAIVGNLIPSEWLNNLEYNSSMTPQLLYKDGAGVLNNNTRMNAFTYQKSGVRTPYDFEIVSEETQNEGTADAVKNLTELNSIRDEWSANNFLKSLKTELSNPLSDAVPNKFDRERYSICEEDKEQVYLIGVNYDKNTAGVDFRNETFSLRIQSNLPADQPFEPHSLYLFVQAENTILFRDGMVQVLS
jgi:hypothetical protein